MKSQKIQSTVILLLLFSWMNANADGNVVLQSFLRFQKKIQETLFEQEDVKFLIRIGN